MTSDLEMVRTYSGFSVHKSVSYLCT